MIDRYEGLPGIGDVNLTPDRFTSTEVKEEYERLMKELLALFNKPVLTEDDYKKLQQTLNDLSILAKEGDRQTPPSYLTEKLAEKLQRVLDVMASAGIVAGDILDPKDGLDRMNVLKNFEDMVEGQKSPVKFTTIIEMALGDISYEDLSLQMLIYTQFILKGSEHFQSELKGLKDALETNASILSVLEKIKALRSGAGGGDVEWTNYNKPRLDRYIEQYGLKDGTAKYQADLMQWQYAYQRNMLPELERATKPVIPYIEVTSKTIQDLLKYRQDLKNERDKLKALLESATGEDKAQLERATNDLLDNIEKVIADLDNVFKDLDAAFPGGEPPIVDPSQGGSIEQYMKDTQAYYEAASKATYTWLLDGRDQVGGKGGNFANNLNNAATSAQTLNDNQKDELNKVNFAYEQFIKIATSLLTTLNDIIKKLASNIARA